MAPRSKNRKDNTPKPEHKDETPKQGDESAIEATESAASVEETPGMDGGTESEDTEVEATEVTGGAVVEEGNAKVVKPGPKGLDEPAGKVHLVPEAVSGEMNVSDLPRARALFKANLRSIYKKPQETDDQALDRELKIAELRTDIEISPPGLMRDILLAEWDVLPKWVEALGTEGKIGYQAFTAADGTVKFRSIIDGNRTTTALQDLNGQYPKGREIDLKVDDPEKPGEVRTVKVLKLFDKAPVKVYRGISYAGYRQLQLASGNRLQFREGDIAKSVIELIQQQPLTVTKKDAEAFLGAINRNALSTADDFHSMFQELERAALSPKDVADAYVAYKNKAPGVNHPTNADLRKFFPYFKAEVISYAGGKVTLGPLYDPEINPVTMTTDEICRVWAGWPKGRIEYSMGKRDEVVAATFIEHDPEKHEGCKLRDEGATTEDGACTCNTPDLISEFVKQWKGCQGAPKQNRQSQKKLDATALTAIQGGLQSNGAPMASAFVGSLRGADNSADFKAIVDLVNKFEKASWELMKEHAPELHKKFKDDFKKIAAAGIAATVSAKAGAAGSTR